MLRAVAAASPVTTSRSPMKAWATIPPTIVARNNAPLSLAFAFGDISFFRGAGIAAPASALSYGNALAMVDIVLSRGLGGVRRAAGVAISAIACVTRAEFQNVPGLALQHVADGVERGEANGAS